MASDFRAEDGYAPVFTQTGETSFPQLDHWQQVGDDEAAMAHEMTLRNELSGGTQVVRDFEKQWREQIGTKYAITVINGTASLYSAFFGLGIGPGDEVILPTYTWICSFSGALMLGARPVFCESDPASMMLDPEDVRRRITSKTRAIIAVHLWGNVCDMDALMQVSRDTGVPVVEDCSHAHGGSYRGRALGSIGQVGCWSLQGSKPVSAGEGGVMATNDTEIFERACLLGQVNRLKGMDLVTERYGAYQPLGLGMKLRAHPLGIGIAKVQFDKLAELNARRHSIIAEVEAGLADIPGLEPVKVYDGASRAGFYGFPIMHAPEQQDGVSRDRFVELMREEGLPARGNPYPLLHRLPLFAEGFDLFTRNRGPLCGDYPGYQEGDFPVTEEMDRRLIFMPVLSDPTPDAAARVLAALHRAASRAAELVPETA